MDSIGNRLRHARERRLWTQDELAQKSGVRVVTISRIENGHFTKRPHQRTLRSLAEALGIDATWLAFGNHSDPTRPG